MASLATGQTLGKKAGGPGGPVRHEVRHLLRLIGRRPVQSRPSDALLPRRTRPRTVAAAPVARDETRQAVRVVLPGQRASVGASLRRLGGRGRAGALLRLQGSPVRGDAAERKPRPKEAGGVRDVAP